MQFWVNYTLKSEHKHKKLRRMLILEMHFRWHLEVFLHLNSSSQQNNHKRKRGPKKIINNQTGKRRHREKWRQQLAKRGLNRFGLVTGTPRGVSGMQVITVIPLKTHRDRRKRRKEEEGMGG